MKFELNYEVDLSQPVLTQALKQPLFYSDSTAHELTITLKNGTFPTGISGYAYFVHLNNNTTERQELNFGVGNDTCSVEFPAAIYNTLGPISIVVQLVDGEEKTTILALAGEVRPSKSGTVIDCSGIVLPDVDELIAQIDRIRQEAASAQEFIDAAANSVRFNEAQSLTSPQKLMARGNINAPSLSESSADFLYKAFFGDDSNFTLTQNSTAKITKEGRLFTYTRYATNGSTYYWANLTGTEHRSFSGNDTAGLTNIKSHDTDFIDIPGFIRYIMEYSSSKTHKVFAIKTYTELTATSTSTSNNQITLRVVFRKYDEETETYTYSGIYTPATLMSYTYIKDYGLTRVETACTIAFSSDFNDTNAGRVAYGTYDQFAMYLHRRSQSLAGTVILEPVLITTYDSPLS